MTIWKFEFKITDEQEIKLPLNSTVTLVGNDPSGRPCIWAIVDPIEPLRRQKLYVVETGHPLPSATSHLGSFVDGSFVWHVFIGG